MPLRLRPAASACIAGLILIGMAMALSACGASVTARKTTAATPTAPTATSIPTSVPTVVPDISPCAAPTPAPPTPLSGPATIPPSGWTTYTNATYHYTLDYPANWVTQDATASATAFDVFNFDPRQLNWVGDTFPPPPYDKFEVSAFPNPSRLSAADLFTGNQLASPLGAPACSQMVQSVTVAGRAAVEVIQRPVHWSNGLIVVPSIGFWVPDGATMLILTEANAPDGLASSAFLHVIASLAISA